MIINTLGLYVFISKLSMPRKPVVIGELRFNSKGEAKAYFSKILDKYSLGTELSSSEAILMM